MFLRTVVQDYGPGLACRVLLRRRVLSSGTFADGSVTLMLLVLLLLLLLRLALLLLLLLLLLLRPPLLLLLQSALPKLVFAFLCVWVPAGIEAV